VALSPSAWRRTLDRSTAWRLIALGCLLSLLGDTVWEAIELLGGEVPVVSVADLFSAAGYLPLGVGLLALLRDGPGHRDVDAVIDGAIVGVATMTATWLLWVEPSLAVDGSRPAQVIEAGFALADLVLVTLVVRLLLDRARPTDRATVLLALSLASSFVGALTYLVVTHGAPSSYSRWIDVTWIAAYGLLAVAAVSALRESRRPAPAPRPKDTLAAIGARARWSSIARVAALGLALGVPAAIALLRGVVAPDAALVVLGAADLALVGLVTARLGRLVALVRRQLGDARDLHATLAYQATHDLVTGLPNRDLFAAELQRALDVARARGTPGTAAVLFVDIDHFKAVNDTLGHEAGDRLLQAVAGRLTEALRAGDMAARFGGDEFVVLLERVGTPAEAVAVGHRVADAVRAPVAMAGESMVVTATVGVTVADDPDAFAEDVLRQADAALLEGKHRGRDVVVAYDASMRDHLAVWLETENELRRALDGGQLRLHYQPEIDLASSALFGVEALLRWEHPTRGELGPGDFLPVAESSGLIVPVGRWVIEEACRQARRWHDRFGAEAPPISVNVSPTQLAREDVGAHVERVLRDHRLPTAALRVEVTETALVSDHPNVGRQLQKLHDVGVEVAVDDFGTGFHSLSHLKRLAVDLIKIDRSFVAGIGRDRTDDAIIHAVVDLARRLGVRTIAEGVESPGQQALLREAGCDVAQGHLYAPPMTAAEIEAGIAGGSLPLAPPRSGRGPRRALRIAGE
jgi:diguanylate cyclase (GGDEF)-like protein